MKRPSLTYIAFILFMLFPLYWLVTMGFKSNGEIAGAFSLYPQAPTVKNFTVIFTQKAWWMSYVHAAIYVCINVVISISVALPAAYAFARFTFPFKQPLFFSFLVFRMMSPVILLAPMVQIWSDYNLYDTHLGVALAHCLFNIPIAVWMLEGFISSVPRELDDNAFIDGYSMLRFFVKILIPQIAPGIAITAFFCFMFSWVEFLLANALTAVNAKPINGIMTRAAGILSGDFSMVAAVSVLGIIPGLICIFLVRHHLVHGFSMGRIT